jgi:purine-nucleoside/S-methyl-5'-thioadenosine phosphorylase / adenosine deaminase
VSASQLRHELPGAGTVLFTDRSHGSFALPGDPGEGAVAAEQRERALRLAGATALARGRQVHGSTVVRIATAPSNDGGGSSADGAADGQATSLTGLAVMVVSADCLPVAVGGEGAVAMLHCGWRGLAAGVLEEGVGAVRELAGPGPLSAVIGPGAGPCCYEVGPEVHEALAVPREDARIDLAGVARSRLLAAGVGDVRTVELCTICDPRFYSHRREGARAGRQAGIAWLT